MFLHSSEMLALSPSGHQSYCASLNTPVVDIAQLPAGSARAAILIHRDAAQSFGLAVGVRALESGEVALFRYQGPLGAQAELVQAVDFALSFAEELGFLFDGESVMAKLRKADSSALGKWNALMGEPAAPPDTRDRGILGEDDLISLSEVYPTSSESDEATSAPAADGEPEAIGLSRFREEAAGAPSAAATDPNQESNSEIGGQTLGRIPIVKRRVGGDADRRGAVLRLLGSF